MGAGDDSLVGGVIPSEAGPAAGVGGRHAVRHLGSESASG